jgi:uncharacterized membrane protein YecN with MAPEG domain
MASVSLPQAMHVVLLYAALLAFVFVALSVRTLLMRRKLQIAIGDAGNQSMLRAIRAHSNFAEYVPLSLLLILFVEASGANPLFVHALGASVVAGRMSHAFGVSQIKEQYAFRVLGMALTLGPIILAAVRLLFVYVGQRA